MKTLKYIILFLFITLITNDVLGQKILIYSGTCTLYKKTYVGNNKMMSTPVKKAFGKVVLNLTAKKMFIYFDGKLVHTNVYDSNVDDMQGGEGFTMDTEYSAHKFTAERTFIIYYTPYFKSDKNDLGREFVIENYKIN